MTAPPSPPHLSLSHSNSLPLSLSVSGGAVGPFAGRSFVHPYNSFSFLFFFSPIHLPGTPRIETAMLLFLAPSLSATGTCHRFCRCRCVAVAPTHTHTGNAAQERKRERLAQRPRSSSKAKLSLVKKKNSKKKGFSVFPLRSLPRSSPCAAHTEEAEETETGRQAGPQTGTHRSLSTHRASTTGNHQRKRQTQKRKNEQTRIRACPRAWHTT